MGVTAPDGPNTKQKADYEKMSKMSGPQFDRDFATHMVTDHQKDFAEYKKASKSADAAGEYAKGNIPVLQKRDRKVVSLKEVLEQIGSVSSPTTRFDPGFGRKCGDAPAANGH